MRHILAVCAVAAGFVTSGCWQVSVHPFFDNTEPLDEVAGHWVSEGHDPDALDFSSAGKGKWSVKLTEADGDASECLVRFGRVGEALYWDMTAEVPKSGGDLSEMHLLALHSLAKLRLEADTMEVAVLDPQWLREALTDGLVDLPHFREKGGDSDSSVILTASTAELEAFLRSYGEVPEAFGEPTVYHRQP